MESLELNVTISLKSFFFLGDVFMEFESLVGVVSFKRLRRLFNSVDSRLAVGMSYFLDNEFASPENKGIKPKIKWPISAIHITLYICVDLGISIIEFAVRNSARIL